MKCEIARLVGIAVLLFSSVLNTPTASADNNPITLERKSQSLEYSFADIAAAELAMYGVLPAQYMKPQKETREPLGRQDAVRIVYNMFAEGDLEKPNFLKHPFVDVDAEYDEAISWAYQNGVTFGISENLFGTSDITEAEFVTFLLRAMGYGNSFFYTESVEVAGYIGFEYIPFFQSEFTLGNAVQYLSYALDLHASGAEQSLKESLNMKPMLVPEAYPYRIVIAPRTKAEAEKNILMAKNYFPYEISIQGNRMQDDQFTELYREYLDLIYKCDSGEYSREPWWQCIISSWSKVSTSMSYASDSQLSAEDKESYTALSDELYIKYSDGAMSADDYVYQKELLMLNWLPANGPMRISLYYNEPYLLANDTSHVFRLFQDDQVRLWADEQYQSYIAPALEKSAYDAILAAKMLVCRLVSYDPNPTGKTSDGRQDTYRYESHSILGAYLDGHVVCDGYSYLFMYFMQRAGIPCFEMLGSSISSEEAEKGITDHSWVKVKLNDKWYNMDICWEDDFDWGTQLDLKSDNVFRFNRHWAVGFDSGVFASTENYRPY